MNKFTIGLISGLVGAIAGAFGGYIFCKKRYEEEYYSKVKAAIEDEIQHLRTMNDSLNGKAPKEEPAATSEPIPEEPKEEPNFQNTYYRAIARARQAMTENPIADDPDAPEALNEDEQFRIGVKEPPRLITHQEFDNLGGFWHYSEWDYLMRDGMVLDENDQPVEQGDLYLGDCIAELLSPQNDGEEIFVIAPQFGEAIRLKLVDADYEALFGHEFEGWD